MRSSGHKLLTRAYSLSILHVLEMSVNAAYRKLQAGS